MKSKTGLFLICFRVLCAAGGADSLYAETALDMDGAARLALEKNLSLERSRMEVSSAKRRADRSWNSLSPSLSAGALATHPLPLTGPVPPAQNEWMQGFTLSASVQFSPAVIATIRQMKEEYEAGLVNYEAARRELEFQVKRLYCQLLLLKANAALAEQNAASAQSRYDQTAAMYRAGRASNIDELSARLESQTQRANLEDAKTNYENALDSLKSLLLIPLEETVLLRGSLETIGIPEQIAPEEGREPLAVSARRKSIAALETKRNAARTQSWAPSLGLSWESTPLYSGRASAWTDSGRFSVTLSLKLDNLFPWSPAKEQIDTIGDSIAAQQNILKETVLNHGSAVQKLNRSAAQSRRNLETLRLNVTLAEESYAACEEAYRRGAADLQRLNSAWDDAALAKNRLLAEQYNLVSAVLELEKELNVSLL